MSKYSGPLMSFLSWDFFSSVEYHPTYFLSQGIHQIDDAGAVRRDGDIVAGLGLLAALIASKKANPFIKECLDYYGSRHFIQEDGSLYVDVINPGIMAMLATKYGFRYKDENQLLDGNMMVYSSAYSQAILRREARSPIPCIIVTGLGGKNSENPNERLYKKGFYIRKENNFRDAAE